MSVLVVAHVRDEMLDEVDLLQLIPLVEVLDTRVSLVEVLLRGGHVVTIVRQGRGRRRVGGQHGSSGPLHLINITRTHYLFLKLEEVEAINTEEHPSVKTIFNEKEGGHGSCLRQ